MRSTSTVPLTSTARQAADSPAARTLARAGLGLLAFGVYGLCEARWRRV